MGESDLQAFYNSNNKKCTENFYSEISETATNVDLFKGLIQSFLKSGKVHDALNACISAYSSGFLDSTSLEIFVQGLVEKARENLTKNVKFNIGCFLCSMCGEIMADPVTLKCGHTFSKKCMLTVMKSDYFDCKKCGKRHNSAYISQLKNNVTISALIEKLMESSVWKTQNDDNKSNTSADFPGSICDISSQIPSYYQKNALLTEVETHSAALHSQSPRAYLKKGDSLVNTEMYEEAIKLYLTCLTFDPNAIQAKENAIKLLHNFFIRHQRKLHARKICHYTIKLKNTILKKKIEITSTNETLRNAESNDCSYFVHKDKMSNEEDEAKDKNNVYMNESVESNKLHRILDNFCNYIEDLSDESVVKNRIDMSCLDKQDFNCALCMRILWEPVSTTCGHTFCRVCLNRWFDHQPNCPLCKTSLASYLAERIQSTTEFLELAIKTLLPDDYADRKEIHKDEMEELSNAGKDPEHVLPLFVCTIAYPAVPCALHVFEPRYRLMIRQCLESGSRQFGMCAFIDNNIADYGTMLEIRDVQYFPDGRSVVDTIGNQRFHILRKGERDGYSTGAVEFLKDEPLIGVNLDDVKEIHDQVHKISQSWFMQIPRDTKHQILQHFGPMPEVEANYLFSPNGPSWFWWMLAVLPIEPRSQLMILSMTSLPQRLKTLYRVLLHLQPPNVA